MHVICVDRATDGKQRFGADPPVVIQNLEGPLFAMSAGEMNNEWGDN